MKAPIGLTIVTGEFIEAKTLVRCRTASGSVESLSRLMVILKREKFTGTVTVGMCSGGVRTIKAEDRQTLPVDMG